MAEEWKKRIQQYRALWKKEPELFKVAEELLGRYDLLPEGSEIMPVVTVYVTAPLLCEYVAWVVQEAVKSGKKRLYFLARDGYYLKKAAEIFCTEWNLDIECRYLYCSRYAWRGAVYHMNIEEALDYITLGGLEAGFSKMMQRAGLTKEEAGQIAEELGYDVSSAKRLSVEERGRLRRELSECDVFLKLVQKHSEEKYSNTMAYLSQEGLLDTVPYALVDSGWTGSLQKSLTKLLQSVGCENTPEGYYFGMYKVPEEQEAGQYHTYYFAPTNHIRRKVYFNNNVFESIYSAPHGMTVGYEKQDEQGKNGLQDVDAWLPILEQKDNPNKQRLLEAEPLLLEYVQLYANVYKSKFLSEKMEKQCNVSQKRMERLMRLFMGRPTKGEAQEYGSFVFCDDVIGEEKQLLAGRLSWDELKNGFLLGKVRNRVRKSLCVGKESAWPEGSVALLDKRGAFWHCALCEYVRLTLETLRNRKQGKKK